MALTRADALELDAADPLADFRARFVISDPSVLYLDGNSLGRMPVAVRDALTGGFADWGERLVSGWSDWIDAPVRAGDAIAEVIGAPAGTVIACDSVTVNLYKLAGAVLAVSPGDIVVPADEFPTDRYVLEGLARQHGTSVRNDLGDLSGASVVVASVAGYRDGALLDAGELIARGHAAGARVILDLSHAAGSIPLALSDWGAELAVGCTYKYLNAGPGAPGYLYVSRELQDELVSPIQGWFGQEDQFAMERPYSPAGDVRRFLAGTPSPVLLAGVAAGADLVREAGIERLRAKSVAQTSMVVSLCDDWLGELGFTVGSPRDPTRRGSHVSVRHDEAWPITRALIESARVIPDFRGPDSIRLASAPLYTRYVDVWDALERLRDLVASGGFRDFAGAPGRVT